MKYDWDVSLENIQTVAKGLGDLLDQAVFVGGSALGFYVAQYPEKLKDVRGSEDVDIVVEVSTRLAFAKLEEALRKRGFQHDTSKNAPICRWIFAGVQVDVMPTDASILSFSNQWYVAGSKHSIKVDAGKTSISIMSAPYFIASKIDAFKGRGKKSGEYMFSRDLEDIVTLFDGRIELAGEIEASDKQVKAFLKAEIKALLQDQEFVAAMPAFIKPDARANSRIALVKERMAVIGK